MAFCSEKCQKTYSHVGMPKTEWLAKYGLVEIRDGVYSKKCPCCGVQFETTNFQKRFCSPTCNKYAAKFAKKHPEGFTDEELFAARNEANKKRHPRTLKCLYCGKEFVSTSPSNERKYCCASCQSSYLDYGCSKAEHEKRMSERVIALGSWSPYLGGTVTKITNQAKCAWCGIDFESFRGAHCCCAEHASKWFYYGKMSAAEVRQSRKRICKWCLNVFDASSSKQNCCCAQHAEFYTRYRVSLEEHASYVTNPDLKYFNRNAFYIKVYAKSHGITEEQAKAYFELKANEISRLAALSEDEEIRIAETRKRFHRVEMVMLMPVEERWQFSKDWTEEERAYAAEISSAGSVGGFLDDDNEIMISELDDGNI